MVMSIPCHVSVILREALEPVSGKKGTSLVIGHQGHLDVCVADVLHHLATANHSTSSCSPGLSTGALMASITLFRPNQSTVELCSGTLQSTLDLKSKMD